VYADEGEAIITKQENKRRMAGGGGVNLTINLTGTVIDRQAVNEFAERIYPYMRKLDKWGH
jgi:hypothetical protein